MLLQLVLPVNGLNSNFNGDSNNSPGSYADISGKKSCYYIYIIATILNHSYSIQLCMNIT